MSAYLKSSGRLSKTKPIIVAAAHDGAALPVSEDLATRILALPIHPDLSEADVARVCNTVLTNA